MGAKLRRADLVITGEGRLDRSTLMGKGVGELAQRCRELGVACLALGGEAADRAILQRRFKSVRAMTELTTPARAKARAAHWLCELAADSAQQLAHL
jgi:glycerate 2-kinase